MNMPQSRSTAVDELQPPTRFETAAHAARLTLAHVAKPGGQQHSFIEDITRHETQNPLLQDQPPSGGPVIDQEMTNRRTWMAQPATCIHIGMALNPRLVVKRSQQAQQPVSNKPCRAVETIADLKSKAMASVQTTIAALPDDAGSSRALLDRVRQKKAAGAQQQLDKVLL